MQELCELIHASSTQFDHVNVSTVFRKVLKMSRRGGSQDTVAKTLRTLEDSALQNIHDFGSKGIANTLHIMTKERYYKPQETVLLALEGRVESISGEFNEQDVANTLWAFAAMGKKSGERMLGQLEGWTEAISGDFNAQDVTNTLWSMFFFCLHLSVVHCDFLSSLVSVASRRFSQFLAGLNRLDICQVHQFFIA